ncbi:hypothetical protein HYH03_012656 [Edaphochlamys debaryana]|uniref:tRNA (guanine(37)-N1)-methyltransferase n=1 Tax=Edaphochlamys debaryana TaxID=47281 RepID=A0A836BTS6_9CHLO|nr:hypothetical protein HYH03_012656 [Edaphochlamys debaryana]|eukprot:KAG2488861.1 hypothetical protein HYH03_012656 [Edaphochlamys debaryana]
MEVPATSAPPSGGKDAPDGASAPSTSGRDVPSLDRNSFRQELSVLGLRVANRKLTELMKACRGFTLDRPRLKCIVADKGPDGAASSETKLLLLEEGVALEGLPEELRSRIEAEGAQAVPYTVVLEYGMLSTDAVLKRLLPAGVDAPGSFETIGHIAHLNLRDEHLPYRHVIGQVLLDKNPHIKTVVNKVGSIENEFRVFQMEVIAGEQRLETEVIQHGSRFKLDFSQVYWNSRLESEHLRLVGGMERGQVLVDMMAGIGPFAVPAAQRGLTVYANDLNPSSSRYCAANARLNRLGGAVNVFNMDARAFLRLLCDTPGGPAAELRSQAAAAAAAAPAPAAAEPAPASDSAAPAEASTAAAAAEPAAAAASPAAAAHPAKRQKTKASGSAAAAVDVSTPPPAVPPGFVPPAGGLLFDHVVMNLPASAVEFLDCFGGAFDPETWKGRPLPLVHCYTFKRGVETEEDVLSKAESFLGGPMDRAQLSVHTVRDVAPNKLMLCLSFRLTPEIAFRGRA